MTAPTPARAGDLTLFTRDQLAGLAREHLLAGHLIDRAAMPQIIARYGADTMRDVAIAEWMGASPVYTRRMQRALNISGDDVATIFKGIQLDIGAPPQFMDFRFRVLDERHGEFWLDHCGALMDVEPMGEPFVTAMCHHIEDPTFDATAVATNPRARMRPIHRPPRRPADRHPHCHWRVTIDPDAEPLTETEACTLVGRSRAATVEIPPAGGDEGEGRADYAGPFDPDLQLEDFCHGALVTVVEEACLQGHLLVRSFMVELTERFGPDVAEEITAAQLTGVAPVVAERLHRWVSSITGIGELTGLEAVAAVLGLHPAFRPFPYVDAGVDAGDEAVRFAIRGGVVFEEADDLSWLHLLADGRAPDVVGAIVAAVDPRVRARRVDPAPGERAAWEVVLDPDADPVPVPAEVELTRFSTGSEFVFIRRGSEEA